MSFSRAITKRFTERMAYCRGCDAQMPKGTPVVATYSHRNQGQHIYFCIKCSKQIGWLACE